MREIKFRAWDKEKKMWTNWKCYDNMFYFMDKNTGVWIRDDEFKRFILLQYTGLKDKNGKGIYEGDIVNCKEYECCGEIVWDEDVPAFMFDVLEKNGDFYSEWLNEYVDVIEIVGNIYENPELLESRRIR